MVKTLEKQCKDKSIFDCASFKKSNLYIASFISLMFFFLSFICFSVILRQMNAPSIVFVHYGTLQNQKSYNTNRLFSKIKYKLLSWTMAHLKYILYEPTICVEFLMIQYHDIFFKILTSRFCHNFLHLRIEDQGLDRDKNYFQLHCKAFIFIVNVERTT